MFQRLGRVFTKFSKFPFIINNSTKLKYFPIFAGVSLSFAGGYLIQKTQRSLLHTEDIKIQDKINFLKSPINFVTKKDFNKIMSENNNKIIMFSENKLEGAPREFVEKALAEMKNTYKAEPYFIDLNELKPELKKYLSSKGIKIDINEALSKYNFILMNQFNDFWFWTFDLMGAYMTDEVSIEILRYFRGVRTIDSIVFFNENIIIKKQDQLIQNNKYKNSIHFIAYMDNPYNSQNFEKHKMIRKFNTKFTDEYQQSFCWIITDSTLAQKLGISIDEKSIFFRAILKKIWGIFI